MSVSSYRRTSSMPIKLLNYWQLSLIRDIQLLGKDSIKDSLERCGFEVIVNDANDFDSALLEMGKDTDAYLMDFRLTANRGKVDAPTFASTLTQSQPASAKL